MNLVLTAAHELQKFFRKKRWQYCIIGGLAVIRWGAPRTTQDVDVTLLSQLGKEEKIVDSILEQFEGRIPNARDFAIENRVLLCRASNNVPLDISLAGFAYEERFVARASKFKFAPRISLVTAAAEDLIVLKAIADRDLDWVDIRGILERQREQLDWDCVVRELAVLCELKEDKTPFERLEALRSETIANQE